MKPRELQKHFEGKGEVAGYYFTQIHASGYAYVYKGTAPDVPDSWAWNFLDYKKAMDKFEKLNDAGKKAEIFKKQPMQ